MNPSNGWLRSTIKNSALDTESANTSVDARTIGLGSANREKLAKMTTSQNTSTTKNGTGIASSAWLNTSSRVRPMLYLFGFDLLTGVFVLAPLALIDKRPGVTLKGVLRNWGLVFCGNFMGAFTVAVMMAIYVTNGFSTEPSAVGKAIGVVGENRTLGYQKYGANGMGVVPISAMGARSSAGS